MAKVIVAGEVKAVEAGFPAIANPSAAEMVTALTNWYKESEEMVPADAAVRDPKKATASLRPDADDLLDDVKQELSHALRKEAGPGERRVLRLHGFKDTPNLGETPEPEPTPVVPG